MSAAIDAFLEEHRERPWVQGDCFNEDGTRAWERCLDAGVRDDVVAATGGDLYQAYRAYAQKRGLKVPTPGEFGSYVKDVPWVRYEAGREVRRYHGLTLETRAERALSEVRARLFRREVQAGVRAESEQYHRAKRHADGSACDCQRDEAYWTMMEERFDQAWADFTPSPDQERQVDALVEECYGAVIRWRPGDPDPTPLPGWHLHRARADLDQRGDW